MRDLPQHFSAILLLPQLRWHRRGCSPALLRPHSADMTAWHGDARAGMRHRSRAEPARKTARRSARRRRNPARAGLEDLLALSRRFRRSAAFRFRQIRECEIGASCAWPAPERFTDADGSIIGYRDNVLFPLSVEPQGCRQAGDPAARRSITRSARRSAFRSRPRPNCTIKAGATARLRRSPTAEKTVPRAQPLGADAPLSLKAIHRDNAAKPARVLRRYCGTGGTSVALFAEGPSAGLGAAGPRQGRRRTRGAAALRVRARRPAARCRRQRAPTLKVTAVAGTDAIETTFRLD